VKTTEMSLYPSNMIYNTHINIVHSSEDNGGWPSMFKAIFFFS
jgi:hypothetical protein